jgi:hypothetical protein
MELKLFFKTHTFCMCKPRKPNSKHFIVKMGSE